MIDHINHTRSAHIMTVEDPIEYLHRDNMSLVNQREVSVDTPSFAHALRSALRQDPDVILVGEMRDLETVETALLAAETGHLVFSTLHTLDAPESINRIIAVFPPHQQRQVRIQLASVLRAVVSQRLMPRSGGMGRCAAVEVMIATPFIRDCIVDKDKTHLIHGAIAGGTSQYGMQTFDQSIFSLYERGVVSTTRCHASTRDEFKLKCRHRRPLPRVTRCVPPRRATTRNRASALSHSPMIGSGVARWGSRSRSATPVTRTRPSDPHHGAALLGRRELTERQVRQRLAALGTAPDATRR
jgi:twitching motility protein PilT